MRSTKIHAMGTLPEDQVLRKLRYLQSHPNVNIRAECMGWRWFAEVPGQPQIEAGDLRDLLDKLDEQAQ